MALAGQVHSWLAMVEVRNWLVMGVVRSWMQSRNVHHCRALSTLEWVGRTARHVLLSKMVPCTGDAVVLERVELPCTQRGNVHPRRTADDMRVILQVNSHLVFYIFVLSLLF